MIVFKIILILVFISIFYQDYKDRKVYWFLFPAVGVISGFLYYSISLTELFWTSVVMNGSFVTFLLMIIAIYSRYILKLPLVKIFGLGDTLLFVSLIFTFSTVSFITIFVFSLIFSMLLHLILKHFSRINSVPLAGYMSLFFGLAYIVFWSGIINSPYTL